LFGQLQNLAQNRKLPRAGVDGDRTKDRGEFLIGRCANRHRDGLAVNDCGRTRRTFDDDTRFRHAARRHLHPTREERVRLGGLGRGGRKSKEENREENAHDATVTEIRDRTTKTGAARLLH
jgi:hypothetical protein